MNEVLSIVLLAAALVNIMYGVYYMLKDDEKDKLFSKNAKLNFAIGMILLLIYMLITNASSEHIIWIL